MLNEIWECIFYFSTLILQTCFSSLNGIDTWDMSDIKTYPACLSDSDCHKYGVDMKVSKYESQQNAKNTHACFLYFCYPNKPTTKPFKTCRRNKDCKEEGTRRACYR